MADRAEVEALQKELGHRIRRRRMALGYMQPDLARESKIPQAHISRAERGLYRTMNLWMLVHLAKALHTTTDYLLGLSDDPGGVPFEAGKLSVA